MSDVSDKVLTIFRETSGEAAERLDGSRYLADVNSRVAVALSGDSLSDECALRMDEIGFHVVDWQSEAAFIVALCLFPDRFTNEEIREGIEALLIHVPHHILEAARPGGDPTENIFKDDEEIVEQSGPANPAPSVTRAACAPRPPDSEGPLTVDVGSEWIP